MSLYGIRRHCCVTGGSPELGWFALAVLLLMVCRPAATQEASAAYQDAQQQSASSPAPGQQFAAAEAGAITEDQLKQLLAGKALFLREGYLDDSLSFNQHGVLISRSAKGSYTLSGIEISRVRLKKHKVVLEGARYGLHFLGALPYEDPTKAFDRVRITPKKKVVRITIEREALVKPKKERVKGMPRPAPVIARNAATILATAPATSFAATADPKAPSVGALPPSAAAAEPAPSMPLDPAAGLESVTAASSQARSAAVLREALDRIFAQSLDARMIASMPDFWKFYYQAAAAKSDYRPADPAVLRQKNVDVKARLVTNFEPPSNQLAQDNGVAGMALYHVVVGTDGKPGEIAVGRPIGFGLDENAVEAIRSKASFEPARKDGKPVPVFLDLVVQFRLFSNRTAAAAAQPEGEQKGVTPVLPGPYSVQESQTRD